MAYRTSPTEHPNTAHPNTAHPSTGRTPRRWLWPGAAALAVALLLTGLSPLFPRLGAPTGDRALGEAVIDAVGSRDRHHVAIAQLTPGGDEIRYAGFGADEHTEFEIGSITKTFTAVLFAQAIERGEVTADTTLGELFGPAVGAAPEATLLQLATHTSGLPRLPPGNPLPNFVAAVLHTDPYTESADDLLAGLSDISTPTAVKADAAAGEYSNYGYALLGLALAQAADTDYPRLLQERILTPLGMDDTYLPVEPGGLSAGAPRGLAAGGIPASPWTMAASAPAGGIRSTAADMARYLQAIMNTDLPGSAEATTPHALLDEETEIGYGWLIEAQADPALTFHNGGTGGFRSVTGFTADGAGLVVLSDTTRSVDAALDLLSTPAGKETS
ncbi:serine hydrolase domain-containing protein [Brevibacterium luteolum]|uniref:serine hydrolase domain-containing protein n=1 Tax=Brevibacterium luteolum TaxID=199591 RepID=UPI003B6714DC